MQDSFDQKKSSILEEIGITNGGSPDASPKGTIDEICIPIINLINSHEDMVTTSSCSGRVSVFLEGIKDISADDIKIGAKGNYGRWIFVTHEPKSLTNWYKSVDFKYEESDSFGESSDVNTRYILYKFEPLILHVKCRNSEMANKLYSIAMGCGFRESGIGTNNIVAIRISIKLDVPIGFLRQSVDELVSFVSEDYLKIVTKLSLDRFQENFKKLNTLHNAIENSANDNKVPLKEESKDERRERKMREGLARREEVRTLKEQKRREKEQTQHQDPPSSSD